MDKSPSRRDSHHVNNINMVENDDRVNFNMGRVNFNAVSSSSSILNITTTTKQQQIEKLRFPKVLEKSPRQKVYAAKAIELLSQDDQQFALDYLSDKLRAAKQGVSSPVSNPIGYLNKLAKEIANNTLQPSSFGIRDSISDTPAKPAEWEVQKESPEEIERNHKQSMRKLEELKKTIRI